MSIKIKFLVITSLLLLLSSATIFWINRTSFLDDKRSYLYSSALERIQDATEVINGGSNKVMERLQTALLFFDGSVFSPQIKTAAQQQGWGNIQIYRTIEGNATFLDALSESPSLPAAQLQYLQKMPEGKVQTDVNLDRPENMIVYYRKGDLLIYGQLTFEGLKDANQKNTLGFWHPQKKQWKVPVGLANVSEAHGPITAQLTGQSSSVREIQLNGNDYLVSYTWIPQLQAYMFQVFDKGQIYSVLQQTMNKTLLASALIIVLGLIATFFSVDSLTQSISALAGGMSLFASTGQSKPIQLKTNDEVGRMAKVFNSMLEKIQGLLRQTEEKARMEAELETAKEVQTVLLPKPKVDTDHFTLKGFYQPASECGGDLWFHFNDDKRLFVFIADATGHGVPAALITAAARSVLSLSMAENMWDPSKVLSMMNQVLCDLAKGEKMMTAFAALYDREAGTLTYSNASHDFPMISPLPPEGKKIKKNDLVFLTDANSKRLGESRESQFHTATVPLMPGGVFFAYTDGLIDAVNGTGTAYGERAVIKTAVDCTNRGSSKSLHDIMQKQIVEYIENQEQPDDITFLGLYIKQT
ncbi:SpoIIE family protein phosphatase [Bdellovibrio bacteriovorus]|uniref:SpoIIE family protein phosphatase n=1 Tax=Bdellovibrio bacteriovorus TaxID=959 RepID=UPI0035A6168C